MVSKSETGVRLILHGGPHITTEISMVESEKQNFLWNVFNTKHNCRLVHSKQQIMEKIEIFDWKLVSKHTERQSCAGSEILSW